MFITTAGRTNESMILRAKEIAKELQVEYVSRRKQSVLTLQQNQMSDCIVVGKDRLEWFLTGQAEPFFFHPNSAMFRVKRVLRGEHDPLVEALALKKGMTILDGTLGLASDSIVASLIVGKEGRVVGLEANPYLAYMVKVGLNTWESPVDEMNQAMKRIEVKHFHTLDFLCNLPSKEFDCVYVDPMFEETILESDGIGVLRHLALHEELTEEIIEHARRVARNRVVLKDHFRSSRFQKYGFTVLKRPSAKFHFGYINS